MIAFSRREFLAGATAALVLPHLERWSSGTRPDARCTVLDLGEQCSLRESLAGYRTAIAAATPRAPVLIVPAALMIPMREIERHLLGGGTVILESGAMFADACVFAAHREALGTSLGLRIADGVDLWPRRSPYVHYSWPVPTAVRDFSRAIPLPSQTGTTIATADEHAVALGLSIGSGHLVFLGSPLGPALWAGDVEARNWLRALVSI